MADASKNRIGDYQRLQLLGAGAQGRVFKAVCEEASNANVTLGEVVAIKILQRQITDEEAIARLQHQSEVLQTLIHRNIVRYREFFARRESEWDEDLCLVMELLEGDDLKAMIKERPSGMPWEQVRSIFEQCLDGLIYARSKGVYHRDVKPSNIVITNDGTVKLIDFGIAHVDDSGPTTTGDFKGTFDYMAPDFVLLPHLNDYEPCDIFSLGVCFYQALTGELPFPSFTGNAHIGYVTRWQSPKPAEPSFNAKVFRVYPQARLFLLKCLAPRRESRYQTFAEVREALKSITPRTIRHKGGDTYECEAWIGRGGFGEVYRARRIRDGRVVAIKRLASPHTPQRFIKEARLIEGFRNTHIVEYVDFLQTERSDGSTDYYLILEYLEGMPDSSLRNRIKAAPSGMPVEEVLALFDGYLDALQHLHDGNGQAVIIHRDIKPSNLYAPEGKPAFAKVFDLGVARDVKGTATAGTIPGTLDYMPPEFADGDDRGTQQSDIYSLGLCLYEALTGRPVFPPLPRAERLAWPQFKARSSNAPRLDFSAQVFQEYPLLAEVIRKALEQKPRRRFTSAEAMRKELRAVVARLHPVVEVEEIVRSQDGTSEPETRIGDGGDATIGVAATKAPLTVQRTAEPETIGARAGQTHGAGTVTVAPVGGTFSGGGLRAQFDDFKARRARFRKALMLTSVAALVLACIGGVGWWWSGFRTTLQIGGIATFLDQEAQPSADYVRELMRRKVALDRIALDRPGTPALGDCRSRIGVRIQAVPVCFSNGVVQALAGGEISAASNLVGQFTTLEGELAAIGVPRAAIDGVEAWMSRAIGMASFETTFKDLTRRMPPEITRANLSTVEMLMADIERASRADWPHVQLERKASLKSMAASLGSNTVQYIDRLKSEARQSDGAFQELRRMVEATPRLVECVRGAYDRALRDVAKAREQRTLSQRKERLIASTLVVADEKALAQALDDFAELLTHPDLSPDDRQQMEKAMQECCRRRARELADKAITAYRGLDLSGGQPYADALESLVARSERWFRADDQIQDARSRVSTARNQAQSELDAKRMAMEQAVLGMKASLSNIRQAADRCFATLQEAKAVIGQLDAARTGLKRVADSQPGLVLAYSNAVAACRKAASEFVSRRSDPAGRLARINAMIELMEADDIAGMLDDGARALAASLVRERGVFVVRVGNTSDQDVRVKAGSGDPVARIGRGQQSVDVLVDASGRDVPKAIVFEAMDKGYVPQVTEIKVVGGGGMELAVRRFEVAPVEMRLVMPPTESGESPARCAYRTAGSGPWAEWPESGHRLQPGEYEMRISRGDHEPVERRLTVERGAGTCEVKGPAAHEWKPSFSLAALVEMRRLSRTGDLAALAQVLGKGDPVFQWQGYSDEFRALKEQCYGKITREMQEKLPQADAVVLAYCANLYQVAEPPLNKRRRLKDGIQRPLLNPLLPAYPLPAIGDEQVKAQYRRLQAWQASASDLATDSGRGQLAQVLRRLGSEIQAVAPSVADRCLFEGELLSWDGAGAIPEDMGVRVAELARWQAHAGFYPFHPLPEVLDLLVRYQQGGGKANAYDLRLACYAAAYCWNNYIQGAMTRKKDGYVVDEKGSTYNPERAYREAIRTKRAAAKQALAQLVKLMGASGMADRQDIARYLGEQHDAESAMVIRVFQDKGTIVGKDVTDEFRKVRVVDGRLSPEDYGVLVDLLAD